jgi:lipopolysaccharide transport system ATP-binding protein
MRPFMNDIAISVENLSKRYIIGHQRDPRDGLRHAFESLLRSPLRWLNQQRAVRTASREEFWALRGVSFEAIRGDVIGVVGRNGAGKSTLLKVLSRITEPTTGCIRIKGRVASLLEVGTGFHQELTGRENIFLNGAILGMSKAEIRRKFDEIVAFSEIEKFLDTPVKRYSSGMYVRLAFAVAAHLEPEILIVDEVLAVGDAQFQKKCLGKMKDVSTSGRTVLFVSHNMSSVMQLCRKGLFLNKGKVEATGDIRSVVDKYLSVGVNYSGHWARPLVHSPLSGVHFEDVAVYNAKHELSGHIDCSRSFSIRLRFRATSTFTRAQIVIRFTNRDGIPVLSTCNTDHAGAFVTIPTGVHTYIVGFPANFFTAGIYTLQITAHVPRERILDIIDNDFAICIEHTGESSTLLDDRQGVVNPLLPWLMQTRSADTPVLSSGATIGCAAETPST